MVDDVVDDPEVLGDDPSPSTRRTGRPTGSLKLTPEIQEQILTYIRAGAFKHVAAQAAGVPVRTFYEWMQRGEGQHPSRPATPELASFAHEVRIAQAQARAAAEIRVYRDNPRWWLSHAARTRPEDEGWTEPATPREEASASDRLVALIRQLDERDEQDPGSPALVDRSPANRVPPMPQIPPRPDEGR